MIPTIFCILAGLAFGSFLNVCITRLPRGESVVRPGSRCRKCGQPVANRDNIPLLSWLALRGRCRICGASIGLRYPLVELATSLLFLACWFYFSSVAEAAAWALLCFLLLGLAVMDAETMLLPDWFTLPGLALGVLVAGARGAAGKADLDASLDLSAGLRSAGTALLDALIAALFLLLIFGLYWLARRRPGLGMGDVKLLAMLAAWLGLTRAALAFVLAVVLGAVYGLALLAAKPRSRRRTDGPLAIAFGAFLSLGGLYCIFLGERTLRWYLEFFR